MTISHRGSSATVFLPLSFPCPFRGFVADAYKPDDHYDVINFDERVIRSGQEVKGASNVPLPSSRGHNGEVAAPRESADRNLAKLIDITERDWQKSFVSDERNHVNLTGDDEPQYSVKLASS